MKNDLAKGVVDIFTFTKMWESNHSITEANIFFPYEMPWTDGCSYLHSPREPALRLLAIIKKLDTHSCSKKAL